MQESLLAAGAQTRNPPEKFLDSLAGETEAGCPLSKNPTTALDPLGIGPSNLAPDPK